eukprot:TRINITY_DN12200_c0_g1_i1.p1 TRINITY_DN12200_c0_g1~~TRINITY_DN12200_c0_g1_i1.p1  ORF type:complete len:143 (-),score=30.44 TRINITY_DN12200_c0_g1_i1:50-478(-)
MSQLPGSHSQHRKKPKKFPTSEEVKQNNNISRTVAIDYNNLTTRALIGKWTLAGEIFHFYESDGDYKYTTFIELFNGDGSYSIDTQTNEIVLTGHYFMWNGNEHFENHNRRYAIGDWEANAVPRPDSWEEMFLEGKRVFRLS